MFVIELLTIPNIIGFILGLWSSWGVIKTNSYEDWKRLDRGGVIIVGVGCIGLIFLAMILANICYVVTLKMFTIE